MGATLKFIVSLINVEIHAKYVFTVLSLYDTLFHDD